MSARRKDKSGFFCFELCGKIDGRLIIEMPVVNAFDGFGIFMQHALIDRAVMLWLFHEISRVGEDDNEPVTAVVYGELYRDGVCHSAIVIEVMVHLYRAAEAGKRAGCHDGFVVIPDDIIFGKISGFPGHSIGGWHVEFGWIVHDRIIVDRIFTVRIGQCPIDIFKSEEVAGVKEAADA